MKLHLHPKVVYRIPRFPYEAKLQECWEELKISIAASSKDFYTQIADVAAKDIEQLPERTRQTIWKYFNRARYRCVPYGSFASVGIFDMQGSYQTPLVISAQPTVHSYTDWSAIEKYEPAIDLNQDRLLANSSWYLTTDGIRYLAKGDDGYELLDNVQVDLVLEILRCCEYPITLQVLKTSLACDLQHEELEQILREMIDLQMLFTSAHSHIIGADYWEKINFREETGLQSYEISINHYRGGTLPGRVFRYIPELAERLDQMVKSKQSTALADFISRFLQRFEGKEIPLMIALDPEMGIGYAELARSTDEDDLIAALAAKKQSKVKKESPAELFFKGHLGTERVKIIDLEKMELPASGKEDRLPVPNTTSLLCSIADELLVVDLFGGATANALHGRFSLASENIRLLGIDLCQLEAGANPDVLFFDIAYQVGNRIDNVNRRASLYDYSLAILNYDTSSAPLNLSDIMVSISGDTVLLRSKKYNKRLIPRMASAYNYTKSDLSLFRFLCDVQHQGIQSYLQLSLSAVFEGLNYYPRVQFRNIIVSPAKWRLKRDTIFNDHRKDIDYCRDQLKAAGVGQYFKSGFSDQTLIYSIDRDEDINAFLINIDKQKDVEIEEAFIGQRADVVDEHGKAYCSQFVLSYTHDQEIYGGLAGTIPATSPSVKLPGSEWLYFEIFCHPQRANMLLQQQIRLFLSHHSGTIDQWFFIRYNENGPHLRVRFKIKHEAAHQPILADFSKRFLPEMESGMVSDLLLRSYKREVHRYGEKMMDRVEQHFCIDSNCVLELINVEDGQLYQHCISLIRRVAESYIFSQEEFDALIRRMSNAYNHEHGLKATEFKQLNDGYKRFLQGKGAAWNAAQQGGIEQLGNSLVSTLNQCEPERREQLFADLMHMHVNRLFSSNQRTHEMLVYYYCHKQHLAIRRP